MVVGAARMRRTLGLVVAIGARPATAARMLVLHAALVGVLGSVIGVFGGVVATQVIRGVIAVSGLTKAAGDTARAWSVPPWWVLVALLIIGIVLAVLAALPAVITALKRSPVDAIADRATTSAISHPNHTRKETRKGAISGTILTVLGAVACLLVPVAPAGVLVAAFGVGALCIGAILLVPMLLRVIAVTVRVLPRAVMMRTAAREATRNLARTAPAVCTVLMCIAGVGALVTITGTVQANSERTDTAMVAPGMVEIGVNTPINDTVDKHIVDAVVGRLRDSGMVHDVADVYSLDGVVVDALPVPGAACPDGEDVSVVSATDPGASVTCVPQDVAYRPGLKFPSFIGNQVAVMTPQAMRFTGLPGADRAADVLSQGGVVVNNATRIADDGTVALKV